MNFPKWPLFGIFIAMPFSLCNQNMVGYLDINKGLNFRFKSCGSPPGVIVADTLSFNAKIGLVDF